MFVRGLIIGCSIAAPVGPIGVLCIRRSLTDGRVAGFVSGLGAATADAIYGGVAAFGLTAVSSVLVSQRDWMRLLGGLFLCYLGVRTMLSRPIDAAATPAPRRDLLGAYTSTVFLTLTNPMTILSFAAIFAGLGLGVATTGYGSAAAMVAGVFAGSTAWWLALSTAASALRARATPAGLRWVNYLSGGVIAGFGVLALATLRR